jgi:hypothetical protein
MQIAGMKQLDFMAGYSRLIRLSEIGDPLEKIAGAVNFEEFCLSFQRFLGLSLGNKVPDAKTIWHFREKIKRRSEWRADDGFNAWHGQGKL